VLEANSDNFAKEVLESKIPVVVDYWAPWCQPCKMLAPIFESVSKQFTDKIKFVKCNIEENQEIATENGIMSIPCLVIYKDGKEEGRLVGNQSEDILVQQLRTFL
jgi:thioredoxin 1